MEARLASAADARDVTQAGGGCVVVLGANASATNKAARYVRALRRSGVHAPVLLVTSGTLHQWVLAALEAGANDFIQRSSVREELGLRLGVLFARTVRRPRDQRIRLADLEIDRESRAASRGRTTVLLTNREYRMLECLAEHAGEPVKREELARYVWGCGAKDRKESNLVDVYILYVRRKLSALGYPSAVRTLRGVGYTMVVAAKL